MQSHSDLIEPRKLPPLIWTKCWTQRCRTHVHVRDIRQPSFCWECQNKRGPRAGH